MRALRTVMLAAGTLGLLALILHLGAGQIASALTRLTWWQFLALCLLYGLNVAIDTVGWQYTLARDRAPFLKLLAARCAGEAANALTALASVGGEAIKAWLVRMEIPYEESVPSLILAKTAELLAQTALLAVGVLMASTSGIVGSALVTAMSWLLAVEVLAVGGFVLVQVVGVMGKADRVLAWLGLGEARRAEQLEASLRGFYRTEWRRFAVSTALHMIGWIIGILDAFLILWSLRLSSSVVLATIIEALWSGVRFATFFVPGSLGPLEGANAVAFPALGLAASAGLAFTLVRRTRQLVWIGVGIVVLMVMRPSRGVVDTAPSAAG